MTTARRRAPVWSRLADLIDPVPLEGYKRVTLRLKQVIGTGPRVLLIGGRQSGKTLAAGEHFADRIINSDHEYALVGPTFGQARDVMMEHPRSGLLIAMARRGVRVARGGGGEWSWNRTLGELRHGDRVAARIDGASDGAQRVQGHSIAGYWLDELRLVADQPARQTIFESLEYALSASENPQRVLTTATRPTGLIKELVRSERWDTRWLPMAENEENLPAAYFAQMMAGKDTRLGRQEVGGELLEDAEGALTKREWWNRSAVTEPPHPSLVTDAAVGVDPGEPGPQRSQALVVAQRTADRAIWITRAERSGDEPSEFLRHALRIAHDLGAMLVVERNWLGAAGMELLESVMREMGIRVPYHAVHVTVGKRVRAEPVAHLIETGHVHACLGAGSDVADLVDGWCSWDGTGESPHLIDASVFAVGQLSAGGHAGALPDSVVPWGGSSSDVVPWDEVQSV